MPPPVLTHADVGAVPPHRGDHYLPDFLGSPGNPGDATQCRSPFVVTTLELARAYGKTKPRREILKGLIAYRARLRALGIAGVQWLNGSFVGDVEQRENRDPGDIDVVTYFSPQRPPADLLQADPDIFSTPKIKQAFSVDGYYVTLQNPWALLQQASYWHGMWSRSKLGSIPSMKGFLALNLDAAAADDDAAKDLLDQLERGSP